MKTFEIRAGSEAESPHLIGGAEPLTLICGPCVIESREHALRTAEKLVEISRGTGLKLVYKSSYDKANRTSRTAYRGLGIDEGLAILSEVREVHGLPIITDVHSPEEAQAAGDVVDIVQIPAFLCRQTNLLLAAGETGKVVMVKKGQFLHPSDMQFAAEKVCSTGNDRVLLCERGTCFGYRELVVDFKGLEIMRGLGYPVVFDATHSVQVMGGAGGSSSGNRDMVPTLARAAVAVGVDGLFLECHEDPDNAPSDGPNMIPLDQFAPLLKDLATLSNATLETRGKCVTSVE